MRAITPSQIEQFRADGFLILDRLLSADEVQRARSRFEPLFRGEFETGLCPDEWNWCEGRDPPDRTRQICNGWMSLDDTTAAGGTIEYARGSHRWGVFPKIRQFHAPDDYREALRAAARSVGAEVDLVPVEVPAGGCAIHAGGTWHGSDANRSGRPRRSLVTHCLASEARFHPTEVSTIYSRYHRIGDDAT